MKIRAGFVSNSSSTSFLISNTSDQPKTLIDFVKENKHLLDEYKTKYAINNKRYTHKAILKDAENMAIKFAPKQTVVLVFGDGDGTVIGRVYDYALRDGGFSSSFAWQQHESLR